MSKKNVRVEISTAGARALMTSPRMIAVLEAKADRALQALPGGYDKDVYPSGKTRANVAVYAKTFSARRDNARNNSLLKAIGGGGS